VNGAAVYQRCEFKSRRGKNKNLTGVKHQSINITNLFTFTWFGDFTEFDFSVLSSPLCDKSFSLVFFVLSLSLSMFTTLESVFSSLSSSCCSLIKSWMTARESFFLSLVSDSLFLSKLMKMTYHKVVTKGQKNQILWSLRISYPCRCHYWLVKREVNFSINTNVDVITDWWSGRWISRLIPM
jgi:hypothetical protein